MSGGQRLAVDVGGTFTDFVLADRQTGTLSFGKVLTTPLDPSQGFLSGTSELLESHGPGSGPLDSVVHATTLVGNAIIEHKSFRTALITTEGFADVLTLRREFRYDIYDPHLTFPPVLIPRRFRFEVKERINAKGEVLVPLTREEIARVIRLVDPDKFDSVAICLLHSYRNSSHERSLEASLHEHYPGLPVSASCDVVAQAGEYERTCAVAINAATQPLTAKYLSNIRSGLAERGLPEEVHCMSSTGGLLTRDTAAKYPVRLLESGPVSGALGAAEYGRLLGKPDLLSFDMGGTTAKACVIRGSMPARVNEFEVARVQRLTKGSGLPVRLPAIDMLEIGAGGGSIARVDEVGLITVGPDSAGASPGPMCYGTGGDHPTVTDANLILGYLDPAYFLGGELVLDAAVASAGFEVLAKKVQDTALRTAWGVHEIVSQNMANALRTHAIEKGVDYRKFSMIAFGGAGPTHAYRIARLLKMNEVIFPVGAGVFSAVGLLSAPLRFDSVRTAPAPLTDLDMNEVEGLFAEMESDLRTLLAAAGVALVQMTFTRSVDLKYTGQANTMELELGRRSFDSDLITEQFNRFYEEQYGWAIRSSPIEAVNWRCWAAGPRPEFTPSVEVSSSSARRAQSHRRVFISPERGFQDCKVLDRYGISPGARVAGPAIIEERECSIFVGPEASAVIDPSGTIVMTVSRQ
jgi:N-methylhydantoinase A